MGAGNRLEFSNPSKLSLKWGVVLKNWRLQISFTARNGAQALRASQTSP